MIITRDFNIYEFQFTNKRSLIDIIVKENDNIYDEYGLESDMNIASREIWRHLVSN